MRRVLIVAAAVGLSGCASVMRGTEQDVAFESQPAGAEMRTTEAQVCTTPCTLKLLRRKEFTATFTKPGYESQSVMVKPELVGEGVAGAAGNVLIGGLIGIGVDAYNKAAYDLMPNPVSVILTPLPQREQRIPHKRKRRSTPVS